MLQFPTMNRLRPLLLAILVAGALSAPRSARAASPDHFTLRAATGDATFSLASARGHYVALHFLLKTECPYCLRHTREYFTQAATLPGVIQIFVKPDTEEEIAKWAAKLPADELTQNPIYRDPDAALARALAVPDGYKFHGQVVHYPATIVFGPDGKEVFRYVGKNNSDRLSFAKLAEKITELKAR